MPAGGDAKAWLLALGLGTVGGAAFALLTLPLPWMLGAMAATTVASVAGAPVRVPKVLRPVMISVIGVMLGSAFSPAILARLGDWALSLAAMAVYLAATMALVAFYYRRVAGFGPVTAYFSAAPGGLTEMVLMGGAMGGDARLISLSHALRVFLVVFAVPGWFRLFGGYAGDGMTTAMGGLAGLSAQDGLLLLGSAVAGVGLGQLLRLPAAALTGPMLISAALHLAGVTASKPPAELVAIAQVVIGSAIGSRFAGMRASELGRAMLVAAGATAIMLGLAGAVAVTLAPLLGVPAAALVLALAPGGLAEMSLISLALGLDVAYIATHHVVRILLVVALAPLGIKGLRR